MFFCSLKYFVHIIKAVLLTAIISVLSCNISYSSVKVSGAISSYTRWTLSESPYIVTDHLIINGNVTLTIDPGVTVKFDNGKSIIVNGALRAKGTSDNPIILTSNDAAPYPGAWNGINFRYYSMNGGSIIENAEIKYARYAVYAQSLANPVISKNIISENIFGVYCDYTCMVIQNNEITNNKYGIYSTGQLNVLNIDANIIKGNTNSGIFFDCLGPAITRVTNNEISANNNGVSCKGIIEGRLLVYNNNISGNTSYNLICMTTDMAGGKGADIEADGNWWGQIDINGIDKSIYDYYDDPDFGRVICYFIEDEAIIFEPESPAAEELVQVSSNTVNESSSYESSDISGLSQNFLEDFGTSEDMFYRVYWDRGDGIIDYTEPVAKIEDNQIIWEEEAVIEHEKTYKFAVKSVDSEGNETAVEDPAVIKIIDDDRETVISSYSDNTSVIIPGGGILPYIAEDPLQEDSEVFIEISEKSIRIEYLPEKEILEPLEESLSIKINNNGDPAVIEKDITIVIRYADQDQDGKVDGTDIDETSLIILWFDPVNKRWERDFSTFVDTEQNTCTAKTKREGEFAIFSHKSYTPYPAMNLKGSLAEWNRVKISWILSLSTLWDGYNIYFKDGEYYEKTYKVFYNIYSDNGSGVIDYSKPVAKLSGFQAEWISDYLEPGYYKFAVRVKDLEGNEEKNNVYVGMEIANSESVCAASAYITVPGAGKRIRGNAVTVKAEVSGDIYGVQFQYLNPEYGQWINISTLDMKKPYSVYWNTSYLENGEYLLRAVACDSNGCYDTDAQTISVTIDDVNWDIQEDGNPDVDPNNMHRKQERIRRDKHSEVVIADGTSAAIPSGVIEDEETILDITIMDPETEDELIPEPPVHLKQTGIMRRFEFQNGECMFNDEIILTLPYHDDDDDGIVDNTDVKAKDLKVYYIDEEECEWVEVNEKSNNKNKDKISSKSEADATYVLDENKKTLSAKVTHFTVFGLMGYAPSADLSTVIVYPNPFKPNSGLGHDNICFGGLTEDVKIRIFTVAGRLAREWEGNTAPDYKWEWDGRNDSGDDVASGLYVYVVTADGKEKARGKIVVIR